MSRKNFTSDRADPEPHLSFAKFQGERMGKDVSVSVHADIDTATDAEPDASEAKEPNLENLDAVRSFGDCLSAIIIREEEEEYDARVVKLLAALDFALDAAAAARDAVAASPQIAVTAAEKDATVAAPAEKERERMTRLQLSSLMLLGIVEFLCGAALSILAPFFTSEAAKHGLSVSGSSVVFASVFILQIVFTPLFGRYILQLGSTRLLVAGSICSGLANIAFGFVPEFRTVELFFGMSLVMRSFTALGESAINTAVYPIARGLVPDKYSATAMSCLETTFGLGTMTGPFFGGLLFKLGNFRLPFVVCGTCIVMAGVLAGTLVLFAEKQSVRKANERKNEEEEDLKDEKEFIRIKFRNVLKKPGVVVTCFIVILTGMSTQWYQPTLEPFLSSHFSVTSFQASLFLVVDGAVYALFSPVWGVLLDKRLNKRLLLVVGCSIISVSFLLMGPIRVSSVPLLYQMVFALAVHGVGMAANFIGTLTLLTYEIENNNNKINNGQQINKIQSQGIATSIWITFECVGSFVGSTLGGMSYDFYGWQISCLIVAVLQILGLVVAVIYSLCDGRDEKKQEDDDLEDNSNEESVNNNITIYNQIKEDRTIMRSNVVSYGTNQHIQDI